MVGMAPKLPAGMICGCGSGDDDLRFWARRLPWLMASAAAAAAIKTPIAQPAWLRMELRWGSLLWATAPAAASLLSCSLASAGNSLLSTCPDLPSREKRLCALTSESSSSMACKQTGIRSLQART